MIYTISIQDFYFILHVGCSTR